MGKTSALLSSVLVFIGSARLITPEVVSQILSISVPMAVLSIATGLFVFMYNLTSIGRVDISPLLRALSFALLLMGAISLYTPTLGSLRETYLPLTDIFLMFETGMLLGLASFEPREDSAPVTAYLSLAFFVLWQTVKNKLLVPAPQALQNSRRLAH